ncbi:MAG: hypothetical protein GEV03_11585 [Streptosporangiales bacterium]|nr:hypothetical protein [Streptosporangiales bacterium]
MSVVTFVLTAAHAVVGSVWLGAMAYSIAVVQPRAARLLGLERYEELATVLGAGARWAVLGMCAALALTGAGLVALAYVDRSPGTGWLVLVVAKAVLFGCAATLFGYVSWRLWPARLFALPAELPSLHRAFRRAACALIALVGANMILGIAAHTVLS